MNNSNKMEQLLIECDLSKDIVSVKLCLLMDKGFKRANQKNKFCLCSQDSFLAYFIYLYVLIIILLRVVDHICFEILQGN